MRKTPISEMLTHATVRIECFGPNGEVSTGTGFFFEADCKSDGGYIPVVVTNKHVVGGAVLVKMRLSSLDSSGLPDPARPLNFEVRDFRSLLVSHPSPDVDLCAIIIGDFLNMVLAEGRKACFAALPVDLVATQDELASLLPIEDVTMVGYPNGIWDEFNNLPIIRRGITATSPAKKYNGKEEFMIDAACFPGSSGSPVFLFNQSGWADRAGDFNVGNPRLKLIGILYAGPQHMATGDIVVVDVPVAERYMSIASIPNNLGICINSSRLLELDAEVARHAGSFNIG